MLRFAVSLCRWPLGPQAGHRPWSRLRHSVYYGTLMSSRSYSGYWPFSFFQEHTHQTLVSSPSSLSADNIHISSVGSQSSLNEDLQNNSSNVVVPNSISDLESSDKVSLNSSIEMPILSDPAHMVDVTVPPLTLETNLSESLQNMDQVISSSHGPLFEGAWQVDQYGLGGYGLRATIEYGVEALHSYIGLPWWAAIPCGILLLRVVFFPAVVMSVRSQINMSYIQSEVAELRSRINQYVTLKQRGSAIETNTQLKALLKQHQVYPFRPVFLLLCQMPFLYCYFMAMTDLAKANIPSIMEGGLLWFSNLAMPDPYFLLPICNALFIICGLQVVSRLNPLISAQNSIYKPLVFVFACLSIPFSYLLPCTVQLYILAQTSLHLLIQSLFLSKTIRTFFNIKDPKVAVTQNSISEFGNIPDLMKKIFQIPGLSAAKKPLLRRLDSS